MAGLTFANKVLHLDALQPNSQMLVYPEKGAKVQHSSLFLLHCQCRKKCFLTLTPRRGSDGAPSGRREKTTPVKFGQIILAQMKLEFCSFTVHKKAPKIELN